MKPKPKPQSVRDDQSVRTRNLGRDGLGAYIGDPAAFPESRVVHYNEKFVVINDLFPKSLVHLLILPRDPDKNILRPQEAFDDPVFLADCRKEEEKVRAIVIAELRRKLGQFSKAERVRTEAMEADDLPDELPPGRDWSREVISGTHANPSMNHLHIHVMSRDMSGEYMKKTNHYHSFTTDFFIPIHEYPIAQDDPRRSYRQFPDDMICWRCGRNFKNRISKLKEHLEEEFLEWRQE